LDDWDRVLGRAEFASESGRLRVLMYEVLSGFPRKVSPLRSLVAVRMRKKATRGTVGLTTYRERDEASAEHGTQTVTFYGELFERLSDEAAKGVIAHELAHAWLNEHVSPGSSKRREMEADELARAWGYGRYLDAWRPRPTRIEAHSRWRGALETPSASLTISNSIYVNTPTPMCNHIV
jgi:hypothetical protein